MSFPSIQQILFITTSGRIRLFTQILPLLAKIWRQRKHCFQQPPSVHFDDGRQPGVVQLWKSFISFHCVGSVKSLWNLVRNVLFSKSEHVLVVLSFDKSRLKCVDFLPNLRVPGVKVSLLIFINSIIFTCWTQFFAFASIIIAFGLTGMVHLCTDKLNLRNLSENAWYSYCAITKRHIRYFCC